MDCSTSSRPTSPHHLITRRPSLLAMNDYSRNDPGLFNGSAVAVLGFSHRARSPSQTSQDTSIPTRSRTYPMWSAKKPRQTSKQGEPFDPFELYRRLEKISNDQARAHDRRLAKAEKHKIPQEYRHVPRYAAADFVNTASRNCYENPNVHPLARLVGRASKPAQSQLPTDGLMSHYVDKQDRELQKMKAAADRNQFQRTQILQTAAETDESRDIYKPPQRDFQSLFSSKQGRETPGDGIKSPFTADLDVVDEGIDVSVMPERPIVYQPDDRHDWAQRDETTERRSFRDHILPVLRKTHLIGTSKNQQADDSAREKRLSRRKTSFLSFSLSR
ncbi:hypothetical protein MMC11_006617 [Xylographa trunciseda]|nr:hypothetical protein [Xylographa trunciseda]